MKYFFNIVIKTYQTLCGFSQFIIVWNNYTVTLVYFNLYIYMISIFNTFYSTLQEVIYHGLAFILYLAAGLTLIIEVNHYKNSYGRNYEPYLAASVSQ